MSHQRRRHPVQGSAVPPRTDVKGKDYYCMWAKSFQIAGIYRFLLASIGLHIDEMIANNLHSFMPGCSFKTDQHLKLKVLG